MSVVQLLVANGALAAGALLQGSVGFGAMLVAVPVLVLIDPDLVPGSALVASVPLGCYILWRERHHGSLRDVGWALSGRVLGAPIGVLVLVAVPAQAVGVLFGLLLLATVWASMVSWEVQPTARNGFVAGTISGFSGTTVGVGGPPVAIVYQGDAGPVLRANLSRYFLIGLAISLTSLQVGGELGPDRVQDGLLLVPGLLLGAGLSGTAARTLDRGWARPAVLMTSAASAVVVLVRALS